MKPVFLFVYILMSVPFLLKGQTSDHVYLKTGSVIRGNILEIEPAGHVKIQDHCGNIWFYGMDQVEKITEEPFSPEKNSFRGKGFEPGFVNLSSMGVLVGSSHNAQVAPFSLVMVNGWYNGLGIFAGAGVGIEFLTTNYLPLFADIRYDLGRNDVVPYLVARGGYSFPLSNGYSEYDIDYSYEGGPLAAAGVGIKIRTREHLAWDVEVLYRYQRTSYSEYYEWNDQNYQYTDIYNRVEIRLGFYID